MKLFVRDHLMPWLALACATAVFYAAMLDLPEGMPTLTATANHAH